MATDNETTHENDFAFIHNTPRGQVLIFREPEKVTVMLKIKNIGTASLAIEINEAEDIEDEVFEGLKDFEKVKYLINNALKQEYL